MYAIINTRGYVTAIYESDIGAGFELPAGATMETGFRYRYQDNAWSDAFSGVSDSGIMLAYGTLNEGWDLEDSKTEKIPRIKQHAAYQISELDWKVERATEVDAATGSSTLAAVYTERAAIRTASNVKETALAALTTQAEVVAFDATDF